MVAVAVFVAAACSLTWQMGVDTPIMMYLSNLMVHHDAVPYRDFFDMNLPGSYWVYGAVVRVLGTSDFAMNAANLLVMFLAGICLYLAFSKNGRWWMLFGLGLAALLVFSGRTVFVMQRELLAMVPLSVLLLITLRWEEGWVVWKGGLVGFFIAVLTLIKPQFALYGVPAVVLIWIEASDWRMRVKAFGFMGITFFIPLAWCGIWLFMNHAWEDFVEVTRYWRLYGQMTRFHVFVTPGERVWAILRGIRLMCFSPFAAVAVVSLWVAWLNRVVSRKELMVWGVLLVISVVVPASSGQFWAYHRLPFFCLTLYSASYLSSGRRWWTLGLAAGLAFATISYAGIRVFRETAESSVVSERHDVPNYFGDYLKAHLKEGDTVQPVDWAYGALCGMLKSDALLATRFPYTFYFHHHVNHPLIQKLRKEFLEQLSEAPPRFLLDPFRVIMPTGVDTEIRFAAFEDWRDAHYRIAEEGVHYRIWERVGDGK